MADRDRWPLLCAERDGLAALAATKTIAVPEALACAWSDDDQQGILVLEWVASGPRPAGFLDQFGEELAALHRATAPRPNYGFHGDNFLGATPQCNHWQTCWLTFWRESRLEFQLKLARQKGLATPQLVRGMEWLIHHLDTILIEPARPSLIHGDLWSGNYLCNTRGAPVLIDPAVYYADREAEWGMIELMGGFSRRLWDAYHRAWPVADGFQQRCAVYQLYHLLNHLNLFGSGYLAETIAMLDTIRARRD